MLAKSELKAESSIFLREQVLRDGIGYRVSKA